MPAVAGPCLAAFTRGHRPFILFALGFFALTFGYGFRLPLWEAPDEARHVAVARDVAAGRIPLFLGSPGVVRYLALGEQGVVGQEGQPPLYYLMAAPLVGLADGTWAPQLLLPFPRGAVAAIHALRLASALMALVTLTCVYLTVATLFPARGFALATASFTALTPAFSLASASANNDNAAIMFVSLATMLLVRTLAARQHQFDTLLWATLATMAALLAKLTALIAVPMFVVALAVELLRRESRRFRLQAMLAGSLLAGVASVAWLLSDDWASGAHLRRMIGDPRSPLSLDSPGRVVESILAGKLPTVGEVLFTTYWGFAGWQTRAPLDPKVALALAALTTLALLGTMRFVFSARGFRPLSGGRKLAIAVLYLGLFTALAVLIVSQLGAAEGYAPRLAYARYLFPAITATSLFLLGGLLALSPRRWRVLLALITLTGMATLHIDPTFAGPTEYTGPLALDAARSSQATAADPLARLANGTSVVEYGLSACRLAPGDVLRLTLLWRADSDRREDFAAFAHLIGADGAALAKSDGVPTVHRFPPRLWRTGDLVLDYWELAIPPDARAGPYQLQVGGYTYGKTGAQEQSSARATDGQKSLKFIATAGDSWTSYLVSSGWAPGDTIRYSLDAFVESGSGYRVYFGYYDGAAWQTGAKQGTFFDPGWRRVTGRSTIPEGTSQLFLTIYSVGATAVYVDRVRVEKEVGGQEGGTGNLVANGSFERDLDGWSAGGRERKLLPVGVAGRAALRDSSRFDLAEVIVRPTPTAPPGEAREIGAAFGDGILLSHALIDDRWVERGGPAVTLYWAARGKAQRDYSVSVQLLGPDRTVVAQQDGPLGGFYRTGLWEQGDTLAETYSLSSAGPLPPGRYTLGVAAYDPSSGLRLPAVLDGTAVAGSFVTLRTFAVQ